MGASALGFRAPRLVRMEGNSGLDLNSEAVAVPGLVDFNSQVDPYIIGDFNLSAGSFPDLGEY